MTYKSFISTVMAAAVALTALSSAPARADNDTAKIIAGAAALAIIGVAIAKAADDDDHYVTRRGYYRGHNQFNRHNRYVRQQHYRRHLHRHHPHHHRHYHHSDLQNRHSR